MGLVFTDFETCPLWERLWSIDWIAWCPPPAFSPTSAPHPRRIVHPHPFFKSSGPCFLVTLCGRTKCSSINFQTLSRAGDQLMWVGTLPTKCQHNSVGFLLFYLCTEGLSCPLLSDRAGLARLIGLNSSQPEDTEICFLAESKSFFFFLSIHNLWLFESDP